MLAATTAEGNAFISNAHMLAAYKLQALGNGLVHLTENVLYLRPADKRH